MIDPMHESTGRRMNVANANSIPLEVRIELGRRVMIRQDAEELKPGQVIGMREKTGAAVQVYVDGVHFATGELVVREKKIGVRITGLIEPCKQAAA